MQTFLPYSSFTESAKILDWRRLGKQRVEGMQIINAISGVPRKDGKPYKGWTNHPCSVMWKPYLPALKLYTNIIITEWIKRGYNNNMEYYDVPGCPITDIDTDIEMPHWLGDDRIHSSHRANLLRKDYDYYSQFGWNEDPDSPYVWLDADHKRWYEHYTNNNTRVYF